MKKQLIILGILILVAVLLATFFKGRDNTASGVYENERYGYSLTIPGEHNRQVHTDEHLSIADKAEAVVVQAPQADFESFETFLITELSNTCAADGVNESISCDRITRAESFTAEDGLPGGMVYLNRIHSDLGANASTTGEFGPIFIFSLPPRGDGGESFTVLLIRPPANAPAETIDEEFIRSVAGSVRLSNQNNE